MKLAGLTRLVRIIPVAAWSFAGLAIGVSAAHRTGASVGLSDVALLLIGTVAVQGLFAHALNDLVDWRSGTDRMSPGLLSGGSRVIPLRLLPPSDLPVVAGGALVLAVAVAARFAAKAGWPAWAILGVGLWSAVAYSLPPLSLSYRPLLGEWLCAWPAAFACTTGSFYLLTGHLVRPVFLAGALHATFSIGWLAQHHIPDIDADWAAAPQKRTTPAWIASRLGREWARLVPATYFALASLLALTVVPQALAVFGPPALLASAGAVLSARQDPASLAVQTRLEIALILLASASAAWLAVAIHP